MAIKNKTKKTSANQYSGFSFTKKTMIFICLGLAFIFYGNSIRNGYSMDDELVTTTDRQPNDLSELGIKGIKKIFTSHSFLDGKQIYEYRPISIYTFAIEWSLFGPDEDDKFLPNGKPNIGNRAHISHFINVLLYAFLGIVLFQLLQTLLGQSNSMISAAVVILFMVHPIHSEVVNNIKNRDEILSLIFALLAAIHSFRFIDFKKWKSLFAMLVFILLSLLSKKSNLPFIVMIPLMIYFFRHVNLKNIIFIFLALFIIKFLFNFEKNFFLDLNQDSSLRTFSYHENPLYELEFLDRIPMYFYSNFFYIQKLVFPYPLSFFYGYNSVPLVGFLDWQFYFGLVLMISLLVIAAIGLKQKSIFSFSILYFFLAIGGVANLLSPIPGIFAERLAFSASIGFCLGIVMLYRKFNPESFDENKGLSSKFLFPILIVSLPSLIFSFQRNTIWNSKKSLYLNDVEHQAESAKVNSLLASEYQLEAMNMQKSGNFHFDSLMFKVDSSILYYNKSLNIYFDYESNINNKGVLYYMFKYDYLNCLDIFKSAVEINPKYTEGLINLGNTYCKIAECYSSINSTIPSNELVQNSSTNIKSEDFKFSSDLIQAIAITIQFEYNLGSLFNSKMNQNINSIITLNAKNYETLNTILKQINFSDQFQNLVVNPNSYANDLLQKLKSIRIQIFALENENHKMKNEIFGISNFQKNKYIDSAKFIYQKIIQNEPENKYIFNLQEQFSIVLKDFEWLKEVEEAYIQRFPHEYLGPNYVQLGNAHRALNNLDQSLEMFLKAQTEFSRELSDLRDKIDTSPKNNDRIKVLEKELNKLPLFIDQLKNEINLNDE